MYTAKYACLKSTSRWTMFTILIPKKKKEKEKASQIHPLELKTWYFGDFSSLSFSVYVYIHKHGHRIV